MNAFFENLTALVGLGQEALLLGFFVFLRAGAMMAVLPAFGEQMIPARVRLVLGLAFTAVVAPALAPRLTVEDLGFLPLLTEPVVGLLLGLSLRFMIQALQVAGMIVAQSTSLSQLLGGLDSDPLPAIGTLLTLAGLTLAVALGLHVKVAELLLLSYDLFPFAAMPLSREAADWGLAQVAQMFSLGFALAAPFMIASLIYNLALGVINRAMPQLMVAMVGAPALTLGGLALLALAAPIMLSVWGEAWQAQLLDPFGLPP
jgi:flagellar biosynthetic protein FliR